MRSRNDIGKFLNRRGLLGSGVEVGVSRGDFSRAILDHWQGQKLYLVDCCTPQDRFDYQDIHNVDQPKHDQNLAHAQLQLKPHEGRFEIVRAFSHEAAPRFADASLDFVYIDANHKYPFIAEDLRLWWPKVKLGGLFAGFGFLDGIVEGCTFGVSSAVQEFAREHGLQIRVTYDKLPTWFAIKPTPSETMQHRKMGILTAYDTQAAQLAEWSVPNKRRYCERHRYQFICSTDGFDTSRPQSWSKVKFLLENLAQFDWLFWSDVDSLIMNQTIRLDEFVDDAYDIIIASEDLGIGVYNLNAGQIFVRNCSWSHQFLHDVYAQVQFLHDRLWENRAIIHLWEQNDLSEHIQVVAQRRFNSYISNFRRGDFLLHLPDMPNERRKFLMQIHDQFVVT